MKTNRFVLLLFYLGLSGFAVYAQDSNPLSLSNNALIFIVAIVVIVFSALILWQRSKAAVPPAIDISELKKPENQTEQFLVTEHSPVLLDIPNEHPATERPDGDTRPYLVLDVRQSKSSFLAVGEQRIITPDDTPFVIGSRSNSDLQIVDSHVSGEHLQINFDEASAQYSLIDYNSSNGSRWDGDRMVKKRPYKVTTRRDITLEIAVSYIFTVYVESLESDPVLDDSSFEEKDPIAVDLPIQETLPQGIVAQLNWQSPETHSEQDMQITHTITTIGRGDEMDAQIHHNLISKLHAYLIWKEAKFWLVDTSSNGTWLTTSSQGRIRSEKGAYVPLAADTSFIIEVARDVITLSFRYKILEEIIETPKKEDDVTDKLPELPLGVRPLFHIVRDGESEQRREIRINTSIITIGRATTNIISIPRESIAEEHAKIFWEDDQFWLDDLSGMGMTVNEHKLRHKKMALKHTTIYEIIIHEGQSDEVKLAFYYLIPPEESDSKPTIEDNDRTQKIDSNLHSDIFGDT